LPIWLIEIAEWAGEELGKLGTFAETDLTPIFGGNEKAEQSQIA
jgi:hypothetical protein